MANVTINKIASDTKKQLAGAHLQILDKNGKVVKDFTTTGEASVFNLPKGEYTIKEVSAPEGYDVVKEKTFAVNDENIATTIGTTVRAGTGNKIYTDSEKEIIFIYGQNNQKDLGYCFNAYNHYPDDPAYYDDGVSYDRTSIKDGSLVNGYMSTPRESTDKASLDAIKTIIWNGFASNPDNVQKKYGLTDDELYRITQHAIWYYTDKGPLDFGMPNDALDRNVTDEVLLNALQDIVKTKPSKMIVVLLEDSKKPTENTKTPEEPKTPTTPAVEEPKPSEDTKTSETPTTSTTEEVEQPKATEQPSDNTATQNNNDDNFYAIPVKVQTTDKKIKVNHQKAVNKANNSQKMPKATKVVYTTNKSEALPKTGAKQSALIALIGLGMVVLSGFLYKKNLIN